MRAPNLSVCEDLGKLPYASLGEVAMNRSLLLSLLALSLLFVAGCDDALVPSVSAGERYTCGVTSSGEVQCWGYNEEGQSSPPEGSFERVSAGFNHTCGVTDSGSVECWGRNEYGQSTPPS